MRIANTKFIYFLIFIILYQSIIFAQIDKKVKDSLRHEILYGKTDTAKVYANYYYGDLWVNVNNDSAYHYFDKGKLLARKHKNLILEAKYHSYIITLLNDEGKYKQALIECQKAERLFIESKTTPKNFASVYINMANEWQYLGSFKNASKYYYKALKISEEINHCIFQSVCINNLSSLYAEMKEKNNQLIFAIKGKQKAIDCNDDYRVFSSSLNLVAAYLENNKFKNAKIELLNLEKIKAKLNDSEYDLDLAIMKGEYFFKINNDALSIKNYLIVLEKCKTYDNKEYELASSKQLALIYFRKNNFELASIYANHTLEVSKTIEALSDEAEITKLFSDIEEKKGNFKTSLYFRKKWEFLNDKIALKESKNVSLKLEAEYQTDKKQLQIKTLTQQNELQDLKIKRRFWTTITLFLALLGLGMFAYSQFKNFKTKKALLLAQQDNAVAEERLRIASDMHDDVGSGLSRIRYIVGAIANGQTEQKQGLTKVTEISDDAVQKMKEIIWSLNESNQNLEDLIYYIRGQMSEMVENANVNFVCHLPENIPSVFFGWKRNRNTYLLVKESINNAIKHAEAKTITLDFDISNDLKITVTDDGKGFDTTKNFTGNGLNNYKKRITDLNARYELKSEIDKGTTFWFELPIGVS